MIVITSSESINFDSFYTLLFNSCTITSLIVNTILFQETTPASSSPSVPFTFSSPIVKATPASTPSFSPSVSTHVPVSYIALIWASLHNINTDYDLLLLCRLDLLLVHL